MLYKLRIAGLPLPNLYVAENKTDAKVAKESCLPYVVKPKGIDNKQLVGLILLPTLEKMFPYIKWRKQLGINKYRTLNVNVPGGKGEAHKSGNTNDGTERASIASEHREFEGGVEEDYAVRNLNKYIGDLSSSVNIELLQNLDLLPSFLSDITTNITKNYYGSKIWSEGYNKKLGAVIGNFDQSYATPNLIILDVSGSIPRGISATMLTLIETLRDRCNADLIVTGSTSYFYKCGEELPSPQELRNKIGYGNETDMFMNILNEHILGHHYGNVITFGDYDAPINILWYKEKYIHKLDFSNTIVDNVMCYHTRAHDKTGYANWIFEILGDDVPLTTDKSWCSVIYDD